MTLPEPDVTVHQWGHDREPVVVIDNFSGMADTLLERARSAQYRDPGASYPGIRAWAEPDYLDRRRDLMFQLLGQVFGFRQRVAMEVSTFSLVTMDPASLAPRQRLPHYDSSDPEVIGVMHYLLGPETGGTAFYRHKRTGFEAITPPREAAYNAALEEDARDYGEPPAAYYHGDSDRYELIGEVEARPDRMAIYRGRLLHSGVIPDPAALSSDPAKGRLTVNMFLRGA
ncbi:DUF6445 family protein [Paraurantiacibacter namhicola]|uniref:Uncharacterized protein n=1 Tax=Paraurantiacibacter namhicola TaxID=645517 RepID=A0A1C7D7B7_9SPHN|nr:DUF6445 family protein [Paraurantiacibacter namhicola]ANU07252.1 hypothetical protein A6F65_00942 [Paraurantiacibacter namhicola]